MLLIELSNDEVNAIFDMVAGHTGLQAAVDLDKQQVEIQGTVPNTYRFDIESGAKEQLLKGLDDIDQTLLYEADITRFEKEYDLYAQ